MIENWQEPELTECDILEDLIKELRESKGDNDEELEALEAKLYKLQFGEEHDEKE